MNSKIIAALVGLMMLATPAFAYTNVRSVLYAAGTTEINELSTIAGRDWTEGNSIQVTGYVHEGVKNDGQLYFNNEIYTPGAWEMVESKVMSGTGDTKFKKEVVWWTEDSSVVNGAMLYPTEVHIFAGFSTETFSDEVEVDNVADLPIPGYFAGEFSDNYFLKVWDTNEQFNFKEGVGINMLEDCTPHEPHSWRMPVCENGQC